MKKISSHALLLISFIEIILTMTGCTKSIPVTYNADMTRISNAEDIKNFSLGVAKFEDNRTLVYKDDAKSGSYVALQSPWKFGLTYQNKEYMPVKDIVQDIFVKELGNAGINAKPIDHVLSKKNLPDMRNITQLDKTDYLLGGEILIFEFANDAGFWTVTSHSTVALNLILVKVDGEEVRLDATYNETERENEGLVVLLTTNADTLVNKVLKKVVNQVIQQVSAKMALNCSDVSWKIALNGKAYDLVPNLPNNLGGSP